MEVKGFLKNSLGLRLNQNDNPISHLDHGFVFLGIYFKKDAREISQVKLKKMDRKIEWILSKKNRSGPEKVVAQLTQTVDGWRRYYSFINPESKFSDLDRKIEQSLSKMIRARVNTGVWPKKPPEGITLPQLMPGSADRFRQSLMGLEGTLGSKYWQLICHLLPDEVNFEGRKRRRARDLVNSLLNYGYGVLYSQVLNAIIYAGLITPWPVFCIRTNPASRSWCMIWWRNSGPPWWTGQSSAC